MSGGSWDYAYLKIEEVAAQLCVAKDPLRRAFGKHMKLVAGAMHDVEWVDSFDYGAGAERQAIQDVLGIDARLLEIEVVKSDAREIIQKLNDALAKLDEWK